MAADKTKAPRNVGPKRVLVLIDRTKLPEGTSADQVKAAVVGAATNPSDALDRCDANPNLTFVRVTLPKGAPRAQKAK